jgi:hypothetical protein
VTASTEPQPARDNSDLPEHQVAMVVFTTVRAVDALDGEGIARVAIQQAFKSAASEEHDRLTLMAKFRSGTVPVEIHHVMDLGVAGGNSYVWIQPTNRAYPRVED